MKTSIRVVKIREDGEGGKFLSIIKDSGALQIAYTNSDFEIFLISKFCISGDFWVFDNRLELHQCFLQDSSKVVFNSYFNEKFAKNVLKYVKDIDILRVVDATKIPGCRERVLGCL